MPFEIERKFLIKTLPENLSKYPHKDIEQGYLALDADGTVVRLRRKGDKFFETVKKGFGLVRTELEVEISGEQFEAFWPTTVGKRLEKTRYEIPGEYGTIELDIYGGRLEGVITAEVEFDSAEAANSFVPPEWFGLEVTDDLRYSNHSLALEGKPGEFLK
ncbi:MAG: Adenylate cyclase [Candidatus Uhrbacteria bacterium GW2011_GWE2_45_35]|uniref:Adenylate cyclase n=2 Tax=Candidatus Uhriibacteriota TaxID=1752732 RepID=A0A0G1PS56_9BACT|nr:MAG: Adenylate cyclase [Candidatus Uhrbacteria bacterium GW2011_GWE2_45_35]HBR81035.1 adenylate cyclase [Candidatus Uhrbacteria bacterium]HCU31809.1 adenylate cyclase [Candidatus Uhrbacteria bacterium]